MVKVRKGFTLVELLIVIVIIGILAAAMLLSSGSATASAEASNVVSDLRSMKAAALMLYADSMDFFATDPSATLDVTMIKPYVDNPTKYDGGNGTYVLTFSASKWWVGVNLTGKTKEVKEKLAGRAGTTGLLGSMSLTDKFVTSDTTAYMVAR